MHIVTGGAGFIGSNLVAALCARGAEVMVVDRLRQGVKWRNLAKHPIAGVIPPEALWDFLGAHAPVEAVFHMGAISATTESDGDLVAAVNITLSQRLWDWCAKRGVPFIYASSAATYGDGALGFDDDSSEAALAKLRPLNLYGWSKLAFDRRVAQMLARGQARPPQWAGLRFFNVYGMRHDPNSAYAAVIARFTSRIAAGQPVTIFGDGLQTRDFIDVRDTAQAVLAALDAEHPLRGAVLNVGTGRAVSIATLARLVGAVLGKPVATEHQPAREGEVRDSVAATDRTIELLGFRAATRLEDGLALLCR